MAEDTEDNSINVKVALRVRPMNARELSRGAENIISMSGKTTTVEDPNNEGTTKEFIYDYSYDGTTSQRSIYEDLGTSMLMNAWKGYNCSAFAYGQTGTGKTFTILGHDDMKGLAPNLLEELFKGIESRKQDGLFCRVTISMLEIYNEQLKDLLDMNSKNIRIRTSKTGGVYVENLTWESVSSFEDASDVLERASRNKTVAATMMNASSSRSHVMIGIDLEQTNSKEKTMKKSLIRLADLAGSERVSKTGASGDRLREAYSINMSLSALGNVISALAERGAGKRVFVPYRDSKLTHLMQDALGGNSYTVMIATISPADINYEETVSTMRYANRVKRIKNKVVVNKIDHETLKEMQTARERLIEELAEFKSTFGDQDPKVLKCEEQIKLQDAEIERINQQISGSQGDRMNEQKITTHQGEERRESKKKQDNVPFLLNLHEDPSLSEKISHFIEEGSAITIGNPRTITAEKPDVILLGPSIAKKHAILENKDGTVTVRPLEGVVYINGKKMRTSVMPLDHKMQTSVMPLHHNDRVMFGGNNLGLFVFKNPKQEAALNQQNKSIQNVNFDFAQREIARYAEVEIYLSSEDIFLKEQIVRLEQNVKEANAMAKELNRSISFDIVLISAMCLGEVKDMCHIFIQGWYEVNGVEYEFLWSEEDFYDRFAMMSTVYGKCADKKDVSMTTEEEAQDPFAEPKDASTLIGVAFVPLIGLATMKKTEDKFSISTSRTTGYVHIVISPCNTDGQEVNDYVDPSYLLGHELNFKIKILEATDLPEKYTQTWCQYSFYMDSEDVETKSMSGRNPKYDFCKQYKQTDVTQNFLDYLETSQLIIQVFGKEKSSTDTDLEKTEEQDVDALREKIKELRARKKVKHEKLSKKKAENKELKESIKEKDELLRTITDKAKSSNDPLAKEILEILKDKV